MKTKKTFLLRYLFVVLLIFSSLILMPGISSGMNANNGVSKYNINQSVKYQVDINYTLTHIKNTPQKYYFKVARLNDRQPNSSLTQYTPPVQESELLYNSITGWESIYKGYQDKFNNTYDLFNASLARGEILRLSQRYNVTLNEIDFENINDEDIGTYTPGDEIHDLYMVTEQYYNSNNPGLIALSNSIVNALDNPIEKARDLFNWVVSNIDYEIQDEELGAFIAYNQGFGDCSEYSDLLITLLRIQGIPARKITGFLVTNVANHQPKLGNKYVFDLNFDGVSLTTSYTNEILGHAWVEYYIPSVGWIVSDPTWGNGYFNHIDFLRFNLNIGAWFFLPGSYPAQYLSEFSINPAAVTSDHSAYNYQYTLEITVLNTSFTSSSIPFMSVTIFSIIGLVSVIVLLKRKWSEKKIVYSEN